MCVTYEIALPTVNSQASVRCDSSSDRTEVCLIPDCQLCDLESWILLEGFVDVCQVRALFVVVLSPKTS